jgi:hypothetical protein
MVRIATGIALAAGLLAARCADGADDEWPRYGHDGALTGRTALRGDLARPREAWSIPLSVEEWQLQLRPEPGRRTLRLPQESPAELPRRRLEVPGPALLDLDGSGEPRPAIETYHQRWAKVLPALKGLQRTGWDQVWTTAKICHLELWAHDEGFNRPRRVWQSEPEDTVFTPLCVVRDLDGDGAPEIAVALHYRVMIYDAATGRKESEIRFHSSRSYGWFGVAEVDGDPAPELVVLSDFQSHLDVLDYDPAKPESERLSVKWRREVEKDIEERQRWPQIGPRPLADVTADGLAEIVISLFNDAGDGQWHGVVIEASTGKTLRDLPRRFVQGTADVDGDGAAEIFCAASEGVAVPPFGRAEVLKLTGGETTVVWSRDGAGFAQADLPRLGPDWSTSATQGMRHVLLTEEARRPAFLTLSREAGADADRPAVAIEALRHDGASGVKSLWAVRGLAGEVGALALAAVDGEVTALARLALPARAEAALAAEGAAVEVVGRRPLGTAPHSPVAARLEPDGPVQVLAEGAGSELYCIRAPRRSGESPEVVWRRPARGIGNGAQPGTVAVADLDGDGRREVVAAARSPEGAAALVAIHADGSTLWRRDFPGTPGETPVHNLGGLVYWWPGRFRSPDRVDLFVNLRRGLMHSDTGTLLDGRTGETVWSQARAIAPGKFRWGYAGAPVSAADLWGDAREEIVNLYPVCLWVADGTTGEFLAAEELASRKVVPAWAAYGEPIVFDFDGDGEKEVLLDSPYLLALLDRQGKPRWHGKPRADYPSGRAEDNLGETTNVRHAILDLDGDGRLEIASAGYQDGARAIDPRDGAVLWSLDAPAPTVPRVAAADIDGNGGDDLIYAAGSTLVVLSGDRKQGRILWTWTAPQGSGPLSLPAIADLDGDGRAEIAVQSADGALRCLDGPAETGAVRSDGRADGR